jgi:hypothetical protein
MITLRLLPWQVKKLISSMPTNDSESIMVREQLVQQYCDYLDAEKAAIVGVIPAVAVPSAEEPAYVAPAQALSSVRTYLTRADWSPTYASGSPKKGATRREIIAGTGLAAKYVDEALTALGDAKQLKSDGTGAGKWYRLV